MAKKKVTVETKAPQIVLFLRTCKADMTAYNGFKWPESGTVHAPDWNDKPICGYGLHGSLWGAGDSSHYSTAADAKWLVCAVDFALCVDLDGNHKFPHCEVVFCGDMKGAAAVIQAHADCPRDAKVYGGTSTSGYGGTSTSGDGGTSTSGDGGTSTSGYGGTSTSGYGGTSTSGTRGTSTSGYGGMSTSGDGGTSTSGDGGTSTSGYGGTLCILFWDAEKARYRKRVAEVDGMTILPNTPYILNEKGEFIAKESAK